MYQEIERYGEEVNKNLMGLDDCCWELLMHWRKIVEA